MADAKKVSWAQLRIGIMAAVAMAILGVLIFLLTGSGDIFTSYATLYTYLEDSAAMASSTPVRLNGISIGKIDKIEFSGLKEKGKIIVIRINVKHKMLSQIPAWYNTLPSASVIASAGSMSGAISQRFSRR